MNLCGLAQKAAVASVLCAKKIRDELGVYDSNPKVCGPMPCTASCRDLAFQKMLGCISVSDTVARRISLVPQESNRANKEILTIHVAMGLGMCAIKQVMRCFAHLTCYQNTAYSS